VQPQWADLLKRRKTQRGEGNKEHNKGETGKKQIISEKRSWKDVKRPPWKKRKKLSKTNRKSGVLIGAELQEPEKRANRKKKVSFEEKDSFIRNKPES